MGKQEDRTQSVHLTIRVMSIVGLWPWSPAAKDELPFLGFIKENYRYLLHLPFTFAFIGLMWLEAFVSSNLEQAGQVLYMSITEVALIVKIVNIWHHSSTAWQLMHQLKNAPEYELRSQEEIQSWQGQQRSFKWYFYLYCLASLGVVYSGCIGVLFLEEYVLPFAYFVPFQWQNEQGYWYAYGYSVAGMTLTCISNVTLDTIGCYFMFHISLLYQLLGMRLRSLRNVDNELEFEHQLRMIFKLHHRIRRLTLECQTVVSPYVLSQIILSAFILCFSGYRLQHVEIRGNPGQFVSMLQFVSVMILQIFLPCFYGNQITFHANQLSNEVYNTNWLQCTPHIRRLLNIYMEHLKRPVIIRAGYFFNVGLPIFVKV
ncbi:hypothetical protein ACLKA7_011209 [Drosophila subpalustris]